MYLVIYLALSYFIVIVTMMILVRLAKEKGKGPFAVKGKMGVHSYYDLVVVSGIIFAPISLFLIPVIYIAIKSTMWFTNRVWELISPRF